MKPKCLILGGLGFIGRNLYEELTVLNHFVKIVATHIDEHDAFVTAKVREDIIVGSILDKPFIDKTIQGFDVIFSFAGISGAADSVKDPYYDLNTNLRGHLNILEACRQHNQKALLIFPSSRLVYGKPEYLPVDEKHPLHPESVYAIHKLTVEQYYLLYYRIHKLKTIVFRISNPYGPHQVIGKHHGVLNLMIHNALKNKQIDVYGDGNQKRDFLHIQDLSQLFIKSMACPTLLGGIFNVGYGSGISILDAAKLIAKFAPDAKVQLRPWPELDKKIETGNYISNVSAIQNHTGWNPKVSFELGIQSTVEYYQLYAY